jgi:hypothetical protein
VATGGALDDGSAAEIDALATQVSALANRLEAVDQQGKRATQRIGVVRFNPFPDTGGNQSFVVAMLDAKGDGVVLSSLHSRQGTRVYLKQLTGGRAETALSQEENEAIRRAAAG